MLNKSVKKKDFKIQLEELKTEQTIPQFEQNNRASAEHPGTKA
jgi:hypothetical protein